MRTARNAMIGLAGAALWGIGPAPAPGQEAERAGRPVAPEFKVAFWYRPDAVARTLRYQAYDTRKGQYTGAVDAWLRAMRHDHPEYGAFVREYSLAPLPGQTEEEKLAAAIASECDDIRLVHSDAIPGLLVRPSRGSGELTGGNYLRGYAGGYRAGVRHPGGDFDRHFPGEYRAQDHGFASPPAASRGGIASPTYLFTPNPILR